MDEAKTLVHMSVSAMFASMFIAVAVGLIGIGYMMWAYFSRQDAADQRMSDYANYTSFDNTVVRGQEVLQLIESNDDVFVMILQGDCSDIKCCDIKSNSKVFLYTPYSYMYNTDFSNLDTSNEIVTCATSLEYIKDKRRLPTVDPEYNLGNYSHSQLVSLFTHSNALQVTPEGSSPKNIKGLGDLRTDSNGNLVESGSYAKFMSTLVYDEGTSDIAGVILVRPSAE